MHASAFEWSDEVANVEEKDALIGAAAAAREKKQPETSLGKVQTQSIPRKWFQSPIYTKRISEFATVTVCK